MKKLSDYEWRMIRECAEKGDTYINIANKYNISPGAIGKGLNRRGFRSKRGGVKITKDMQNRLIELYNSGCTTERAANIVGCSRSGAAKYLKNFGICLTKAESKRRKVSDTLRDRVVSLYKEGKTVKEIIKIVDVTSTVIYGELKRRGIDRRRTGARGKFSNKPNICNDILNKYNKGWSLSLLAEVHKCSIDPIKKVLRDNNIEIRTYDSGLGIGFNDKCGRMFYMRSSWELKTAQWLDDNDIYWEYEKESYPLSEGLSYTPDFWLYNKNRELTMVIDVKGHLYPESKKRICKFKKERSDITFEMWNRATLETKGIMSTNIDTSKLSTRNINFRCSREYLNKIIFLYESGKTYKMIGELVNKSSSSIGCMIDKLGIARSGAESKKLNSFKNRQLIHDTYNIGHSIDSTAHILNTTRDIVYEELKTNGAIRSYSESHRTDKYRAKLLDKKISN